MSSPFTPQQQPAHQQQLFTPKQSSSFQQSSPFSITPQQSSSFQLSSSFSEPTVEQNVQLQQFQLQELHQLHLFTNDRAPATYSTKWTDLHPDSQKLLLQIEETILEHWDESQRLDQCSRLYDSSVSSDGFESGASLIVQELGGISTSMKQQKAVIQELVGVVKDMLHNTAVAVRSFLMLQTKFLHPTSNGAPNTSATIQASGGTGQLMTTTIVPIFDFYSGVARKPSPFLQQTVARFDKYLVEFHQLIEELEQLLIVDTDINGINPNSLLLQALPKVMSNAHDFFVHVAAKVESIHQNIESKRTAYIADHRRQGLYNDPFLEADRRETDKEEVAAKRVHPTLHLPAFSQPSTKVSGLTITVPTNPETIVAAASSTSKSSLFATLSAETPSFPLFSTPAKAASSSSLFGGSFTPVQTSLFGASTRTLSGTSLFGSTPSVAASSFSTPFASGIISSPLFSNPATAASSSSLLGGPFTPVQTSLFGASTRTLSGTSLFGSTPSVAASSFSTPFASGIISSPLFSNPATAASSSSLLGGPFTPVQTSLFGASTRTLSGTSLFGSTPSVAASSFSTPFASAKDAATNGSRTSFGTPSERPRVKIRGVRR